MKLVLAKSEIASLISIKERKEPASLRFLPSSSDRERRVALARLSSSTFFTLAPFFLPSKDFELGKHISLHPLTSCCMRRANYSAHSQRTSRPLNSLHSFRLTNASVSGGIAFDRKIVRITEATNSCARI